MDKVFYWALVSAFLLIRCTDNPFSSSQISENNSSLKGKVILNDGSNPSGVYVFLDGFKIGSRIDSTGRFEIKLPPQGNQGVAGGIDGVFYLYYYMANYYLDSSAVVIQNGKFHFDRGDFNKAGDLIRPVSLQKFLNISIELQPKSFMSSERNEVSMLITMNAIEDSVTVVYPGIWDSFTAKTFFKEIYTDSILALTTNLVGHVSGPKELIKRFPSYRIMTFIIQKEIIPQGNYIVSPQLFVTHENLPQSMILSLQRSVNNDEEILFYVPYFQDGGELTVRP